MQRIASFTNSIIKKFDVTVEGFGSMKHMLGNDEFGKLLDRQADEAAQLLAGVAGNLVASPSGENQAKTSFEIKVDSTTIAVTIELGLWQFVDVKMIDTVMDYLTVVLKDNARQLLHPELSPSEEFESTGFGHLLSSLLSGGAAFKPSFYAEFLDGSGHGQRYSPPRPGFDTAGRH